MLTWAKTYENANRRLVAWGLVFTAFPQLVIVHWPGRTHSNVDPLSRLLCIPQYISPARDDLPSPTALTEHEDLQSAWEAFIKECKYAVESKTMTTCCQANCISKTSTSLKKPNPMKDPEIEGTGDNILAKDAPTSIHIHINQDIVEHFVKGYLEDKDFALVLK